MMQQTVSGINFEVLTSHLATLEGPSWGCSFGLVLFIWPSFDTPIYFVNVGNISRFPVVIWATNRSTKSAYFHFETMGRQPCLITFGDRSIAGATQL